MKSKPENNDNKEIISKIQENFSGPQIVMITDTNGNIIDCNIANSIGELVELSELSYIAKMISLRAEVAGYHHLLGGLEVDVSIFKDVFALTSILDKFRILITVVPKTVNLLEAINSLTKFKVKKLKTELNFDR